MVSERLGPRVAEAVHASAKTHLAVAGILLQEPLSKPSDPNGSSLLCHEDYIKLVKGMRAARNKRDRRDVPPSS